MPKGSREASSPRSDPESLRGKLLQKIAHCFMVEEDEQPSEAASDLAANIEEAIAEKHAVGTKEYTTKGRSLIFNLNKNAELRRQLLSSQRTARWLVSASISDLATDALKLQRMESAERYQAMRSLGETSERVVGWNAGTTGKIGWSHKFENEKTVTAASSTTTAAAAVEESLPFGGKFALEGEQAAPDEDAEGADTAEGADAAEDVADAAEGAADAADGDGEEDEEDEEYVPQLMGDAAATEEELEENAGMDDVEIDDLKAAESASEQFSEADDEEYVPEPIKPKPPRPDAAAAAAAAAGRKRPFEALAGSALSEAAASALRAALASVPALGPAAEPARKAVGTAVYTHAPVRQAAVTEAVLGCGIQLGTDEGAIEHRLAEALAKVRKIVADHR